MTRSLLLSLGIGNGKSFDRGSLAMIIVSMSIFFLTLFMEFFIRRPKIDIFTILLGIILIGVGVSLRLIARNNLGKQFRIAVKIVKHHKLVRTGIHRHIRHPMYSGMFLILLGCSMIFSSFWSTTVLFLIIVPVGIYRTYVEEKTLKRYFGKSYRDYCSKTKRFIPYLF